MVSMFPRISFAGGHLENGSITGNRGISRNVSSWNRILRKKICKIGDFHKKSIKTLAPNEFPRSALVYPVAAHYCLVVPEQKDHSQLKPK